MGKTEKYDHMKLIREYAGGHKSLITLGRCLAAVSAVLTLIPFYELWKIIRTAVNGEDPGKITEYAWVAVACSACRLKTIKDADQILVISDGEIVERGDHTSLMDMDGTYAHMVSLQAS